MALTLNQTNDYTYPANAISTNMSVVGADFDGVNVWICHLLLISRVVLVFGRYPITGGAASEVVVWDSGVQFPNTDGGPTGINRGDIAVKDFCKTPTGFAVVFTPDNVSAADNIGDRLYSLDDLWQFTYTGAVATRASRWQVAHNEGVDLGQTLEGVDFANNRWYFLEHHAGDAGTGQDTLDINSHAEPLIAGQGAAQYSTLATISGGTFTEGRFLTRGPDGFYVEDEGVEELRFYDTNGAFVEEQQTNYSGSRGGISYRTGSLVIVSDRRIYLYGSAPVADSPPGAIESIEVFAGDAQLTYRITPPVSSLPITGYQISEDGLTGWSVITVDTNNDYVLTGLQNGVEVTRYFRAVSDAGVGEVSPAVLGTPTASAPPVTPPDPTDPTDPVSPPTVSSGAVQVYGLHQFRRLYDIYRADLDGNLTIVARRVELVQYTKSTDQSVVYGALVQSNFYENFLPVRTDIPYGTGDYIYHSPVTPHTRYNRDAFTHWQITGFFQVGGYSADQGEGADAVVGLPPNRNIIATERQ